MIWCFLFHALCGLVSVLWFVLLVVLPLICLLLPLSTIILLCLSFQRLNLLLLKLVCCLFMRKLCLLALFQLQLHLKLFIRLSELIAINRCIGKAVIQPELL